MAMFSAAGLIEITGGKWLNGLMPECSLEISTDTRCDNCGKIFFALTGEKFDAHNFLEQAKSSGAQALCINRNRQNSAPENIPVLLVDDTLNAMQQCAAFHRRSFPDLTVFAVTGSVGKTSVKEMLRAICSAASSAEQTLFTIGNTNNQIGVCQNLLRLTDKHRFAVLEAGTNSPGEIRILADMIQPSGAIVNSIAPCHLEKLIDLDGVAREKSMIFHQLKRNGTAVFPAVTAGLEILQNASQKNQQMTFGIDGSGDISAVFIDGDLNGSTFELHFPDNKSFKINWHLTGRHNALNAAGAAALAYSSGIPAELIVQALPDTKLPGMRMKKTVVNGITYFNDAYNANPSSMNASISLLSSSKFPGRLFLLLGGMRELGEFSRKAHEELLTAVKEKRPDANLITVGDEFTGISELHFSSPEEAGEYLKKTLLPGDTVFAKGSRGNAVEKALPEEAR